MKKWIKLSADYGDHKAGEIIQVDATEADVIVKGKLGVVTDEPDDVLKKAADLTGELKTFVNAQIDAGIEKGMQSIAKDLATVTKGIAAGKRPRINILGDREDEDPTFGFRHVGEQIRVIKSYFVGDESARKDERIARIIAKAPTTYANEGLGADGGFLLAPNFANELLRHTFVDEALFNRTASYTTGSNSLTVPKDETTPWGTSGVQAYWAAEASQYTQSKPALGQDNLVLQKVTALVPVTDEQLSDSFIGLGQYINQLAGERIRWKVDEAIVNGTGVGQPIGIINSPALVSQAAEGSQTADTINITNLAKMISRSPASSLKSLVWLVHPSAFPQLVIMTNGQQSLYVPPGGLPGTPATMGTLFGIPLLISQHCQAVGDAGDIYLVDLSKYITLTKGTGIDMAMSIHLFFDYNMSTFRFNFRMAGQPWLNAPITSAYGSYQLSPFINLAAR